jgi:prepilin-type N-terminal cleavage/methylation domain-containing protein
MKGSWRQGVATTTERGKRVSRNTGFTLIEVMVAMAIAVGVLGIVLLTTTQLMQSSSDGVALAQSNDKASLALDFLSREVTGANIVYNPTTEGAKAGSSVAAGYSLRIFSVSTGTPRCDQWRLLTTTHQLEYRWWPPHAAGTATTWTVLITGVYNSVNPDMTTKPFKLKDTTTYDGRLLSVNLRLLSSSVKSNKTTQITASYDARNAEFFSPTDSEYCTTIPAPT